MESVPSHDDNFCKFHVLYACTGDACALETRRRFVTEREKKKESQNLNPGLTAWVIVIGFIILATVVNHILHSYFWAPAMVGEMAQNLQSLYSFTFNAVVVFRKYIYSHPTS